MRQDFLLFILAINFETTTRFFTRDEHVIIPFLGLYKALYLIKGSTGNYFIVFLELLGQT